MLRPTAALALAAFLSLPLSSVLAQDKAAAPDTSPKAAAPATGSVDPAAKDFIDKFRAAVKNVNSISCTVSQTMKQGERNDSQTGDLLAVFDRPAKGPAKLKQFKITSKRDKIDGVWAFDGKTAYHADNAAKTFASLESPDGVCHPVGDVAMVVPNWIFGGDVLANPNAKLTSAKLLADSDTDGVKCRTVEYTVEVLYPAPPSEDGEASKSAAERKMTMHQTRIVGIDDMLARKIDSTATYTGMEEEVPEMHFTGVYSNVHANPKIAGDAFALKAPEGYKVEKDPDASELGIPSDDAPKLKFATGDTAPDFNLKARDGSSVSLASLKGRVVLLDFWATWCNPCKMAMPGVQKLHEKYKDKQVSIFGVDTWERAGSDEKSAAKAAAYMDSKSYTYGLLYKGDDLAKSYGISGIPTFVLIGPDSKILYLGVGFDPKSDETISELIDKSLAGKQ